jgi:hypothetical protein
MRCAGNRKVIKDDIFTPALGSSMPASELARPGESTLSERAIEAPVAPSTDREDIGCPFGEVTDALSAAMVLRDTPPYNLL